MKVRVTELLRGQMFKIGKQKNYRRFMETFEIDGELWICYDNGKQMKVMRDEEVVVLKRFPIKGYPDCYTTGEEMHDVLINGKKTKISHFLKDGIRLIFVYSIQNSSGEFVDLDIRNIPDFHNHNNDELIHSGISVLKEHINKYPSQYLHFI